MSGSGVVLCSLLAPACPCSRLLYGKIILLLLKTHEFGEQRQEIRIEGWQIRNSASSIAARSPQPSTLNPSSLELG